MGAAISQYFINKRLFVLLLLTVTSRGFCENSNQGVITVGVVSDLNGTECQSVYPRNSITTFNNLLNNHSLSHVIMTGDLVHGECLSYKGAKPYSQVTQEMWQSFEDNFFSKLSSNTSIAVAPGNHDAPWLTETSRQTFRIENEAFQNFWNKKESSLGVTRLMVLGAEDQYPYYWAYVLEDVLFVVLQSTRTSSLSDGQRQKMWLKAVLNSPEALNARARIVYGHIPPYPVLDPSVGSKYKEFMKSEQVGKVESLMEILLDNNVDLLAVGHSHAPYPGELVRKKDKRKMKILSMPCGHSPRKLKSHKAVSPRGYAVIKIEHTGKISVSIHSWEKGAFVPLDFFPSKIDMKDPLIDYQRVSTEYYF